MRHEIDNLEKLAQLWDKAQADGIFPSEKVAPVAKNSGDSSYFGIVQSSPTQLTECDSKYWKQLWEATRKGITYADPLTLTEITKPNAGDVAKSVINSPNPIVPNSAGKDQDLEPVQLGVTFSPADIEELAELKVSLHSIEDKLNELEGRGQSGSKYESQIAGLRKKIDDLSNRMTQGFPGVDPRNVKPE